MFHHRQRVDLELIDLGKRFLQVRRHQEPPLACSPCVPEQDDAVAGD